MGLLAGPWTHGTPGQPGLGEEAIEDGCGVTYDSRGQPEVGDPPADR